MAYYTLHFKTAEERVQYAFLIEDATDEGALAQGRAIDRGDLSLEVLEGERLVGRFEAQKSAARKVLTPA